MLVTTSRNLGHKFSISFEMLELDDKPCVFLAMDASRDKEHLIDALHAIRQVRPGAPLLYMFLDNAHDDDPEVPTHAENQLDVTLVRVLPGQRVLDDAPTEEEVKFLYAHRARIKQASTACRQELAAA